MIVRKRFLMGILSTLLIQWVIGLKAEPVILVHNTTQEIEACKGKLQLKWIRTWGGEEEQDENKFFVLPLSLVMDSQKNVYISDLYNFCIKAYDITGKYLRTIGQKGRGPTDLVGPGTMSFSPGGDLWVAELGNRRFQCFNTSGKSKSIFKYNGYSVWIAITRNNEIAIYSHGKTFDSKRLLSLHDKKGKMLRQIGVYHSTAKKSLGSETLYFAKDIADNFYAALTWSPVVRRYSYNGSLEMVLTFATPFNVLPVEVRLNKNGDDIEPLDGPEADEFRVKKLANGGFIQSMVAGKGKKWAKYPKCDAIDTDAKKNLYVVTPRRAGTEAESNATSINADAGEYSFIDRQEVNFDLVENIDINRLLVFNPAGKIIAEAPLTTLCDGIYINGNRLFIFDGVVNQRILEYEMTFK